MGAVGGIFDVVLGSYHQFQIVGGPVVQEQATERQFSQILSRSAFCAQSLKQGEQDTVLYT